jgi:hypothetical protein
MNIDSPIPAAAMAELVSLDGVSGLKTVHLD